MRSNQLALCSMCRSIGVGGGGRAGDPDLTLKIHKKGFFSNTGPDPLNNKAFKPAFNVGPSSARQ